MAVAGSQFNVLDKSNAFRLAFNDECLGRQIRKYIIIDHENETIDKATRAIKSLLKHNHNLCATFKSKNLKAKLKINNYLTINDFAVCLAKEREAPSDARREFKDRYFSETLLKKPVRCSQGHILEHKSAKFWIQSKGDVCPAGKHPIGELTIDLELQQEIEKYKKTKEKQDDFFENQKLKDLENRILKTEVEIQGEQISLLNSKQTNTLLITGAGAKIIIKTAGRKTCKVAANFLQKELAKDASKLFVKESSKKLAKFTQKNFSKIVPGVSVVAGVAFAGCRIKKGIEEDSKLEYLKAAGEVVSGVAACFPGTGTAISISLDVLLAGSDISEILKKSNLEAEVDLTYPYKYFDINAKDSEPNKEEVDKAYRKCIKIIHPDANIELGEYYNGRMTELTSKINHVRDSIYEARGWNN